VQKVRILKLASTEIMLLLRNKIALFATFLLPPTIFFLMGETFSDIKVDNFGYADNYLPSWFILAMLTIALYNIAVPMVTYRDNGVFRLYQLTGLKKFQIFFTQMLSAFFCWVICALLLLVVTQVRYNVTTPLYFGDTVIALILSLVSVLTFGFFLVTLAKNQAQSQSLAGLLMPLMIMFSGASVPINLFPDWLQKTIKVIPLYHSVKLLRGVWLHGPLANYTTEVYILLGMTLFFSIIAILNFRWSNVK
jgi:ABC-2 type transport system permease protein